MLSLSGYQIGRQIYAGNRTLVFAGTREVDQQPVIIKLLKSKYPSFSELVQFRNQYTIAKNLEFAGIITTYSLENYQNSYALVMEDFGGISLKEYTGNVPLKIEEFLAIAFQITDALGELYRHGVIHKDIKPANILINPDTKQIKLIDFSIASLLPKETQTLQSANVLEGTLAYISPEQTGRMNRAIDWRSDFYSLGVTFFELLTGQLPFPATDPLELVYCHLAKSAPDICTLNPQVPPIIAQIITKLMAKNAEERYQSASGLRYDLETAWKTYQQTGEFPEFPLASRDIPDRFNIPEKLYGREAEIETLLSAFARISQPSEDQNHTVEMVLVAGFSGIGKTAVVNEVHKPIVRQRGYFIKGKYDQFQRNVPLSAFIQAFRHLMEQLLSESSSQLQTWKTKILAALGEQAQVIIEVIPELEKILGPQPPVNELTGSAATNRFNLLFQKFIQLFSSKDHPLVIFIDDLQWADSASLKLMEIILSEGEIQHLLLIGAYRDNEVSPAHPLMMTLKEIAKNSIPIHTITLPPLSPENITNLVAETLNSPPELVTPLSNLIYQKTQGNPFFSNQLLKSFHEEGIIQFNIENRCWQCEISQIKQAILVDDVVDFMAYKLQKLPSATQQVLKLAACIGNEFDLTTLAIVNHKSPEETATDLWVALREGLIIPTNEVYKLYQQENHHILTANHQHLTTESPNYKFLHDRVQQAAYSLIPESEKKQTHLQIGQLLLENIPQEKQTERIFDIVNHLNYGRELITQELDINQLVNLNFIAARKAKIATAYAAAMSYFNIALSILNHNSWTRQYNFTLQLYEEACEAAYLSGNFVRMEQLAEIVTNSAKTLLEKIKVSEIQIQANIVRNKLTEAFDIALGILKLLNIEFSTTPSHNDIEQAFQNIAEKLKNRKLADLINLPEINNLEILAAMRILLSMFAAAYLGRTEFVPLLSTKMIELSLEYGNTSISAFAYCTYGLLLCSVIGDIETGFECGQLSLKILSKFPNKPLQVKSLLMYNSFIGLWKNHARNFLNPLQQVYLTALEVGDLEFTAYALNNFSYTSYLIGKELHELEYNMSRYCDELERLNQQAASYSVRIWRQTILNLINKSQDVCSLIGESYDENIMLPLHKESNYVMAIAIVNFNKLTLNYLFSNPISALEYSIETEKYLSSITGSLVIPTFYFYDSLVRLLVYSQVTCSQQKELLEKVKSNQQKMHHWATHAPMNFLHKYYLVEAELHRVLDDKLAAIEYYEKAINLAKENEYIHEEALANELAAKFYLSWNKPTIAQAYLINAYYCYAKWGAVAKVNHLEQKYPEFITSVQTKEVFQINSTETIVLNATKNSITAKSSTKVVETLDLISFIKASQAISSEIHLDTLLTKLTQVLIENAGASKAAIIMPNQDKLVIEAVGSSIHKPTNILQSIPIEESQDIPVNLINYIFRTQEKLIVNNIATELKKPKSKISIIADNYLLSQQVQSLLCTPIFNQGKLIAILYLENNLTTGVFSDERMQIINLLSSQAAISLENARLYEQSQNYARQLEANAKQLEESLENLKQAQLQLVQSEKMSTLGNLVSGIGHEINNPIGFLAGNMQPAQEYTQDLLKLINLYQTYYPEPVTEIAQELASVDFEYIQEDLPKVLESMQQAIDRIYDISISLRTFSRSDTQKKIPFNIHDGLNSTLMILKHRLKANQYRPEIQVIKEYDDFSTIKCFPGQLNQVFMNLIANAIDALDEHNQGLSFQEIEANPNCITITTKMNEFREIVTISIKDNGPGMTEEIRSKIFDHLFTTKPVGKGTGLGLAIAYQIIVEKHGGSIDVISAPGEGANFVISIPIE
ncbi:trifunctional serine/threonine-protein kinase/ATP-binding protein/sensor histidine kinase [Calothrix sp. NIES-3974]|uniref:trifunctional serine/threonine-protein kinase/ATP-binding protein/sensor histidine kinase n=1 Tax=Calothrix sp. NIES-3974 TaxID=2005462 RepID=UPI000B5EBC63|nr:ATP-binding sensor histidine kinase [Calothrix sp. NIES-3974]BAZ03483.1 multi-sensor signal transduction multi-kinase [Calothrix sp. NIES-3974]